MKKATLKQWLDSLDDNLMYNPEIGIIIHESHLYEYKLTEDDIIKQKKLDRKENINWIIYLLIGFVGFPILSGFIGYFLPLQYSIPIAVIIGFIAIIRRFNQA